MSKQTFYTGQSVQVKKGWYKAGLKMKVLGPAIFIEQWWIPVLREDTTEPDFYKESSLEPTNEG